MTTPERITGWRKSRGFSMRGLARAADIQTSVLHRIEHGEREPRVDEIERITKALAVTMVQFWGPIPKTPKKKPAAA